MASMRKQTGTREGYKIEWRDSNKRRQMIWLGKRAKKSAETFNRHIVELLDAKAAGRRPDPQTETWLRSRELDTRIRNKLIEKGLAEPQSEKLGTDAGTFLGPYCESYIAGRDDCKAGTKRNFQQVQRLLTEYFGVRQVLATITEADAERFRRWLVARGMADSTVGKHIKRCKTMFKEAVSDRLLNESPFQNQKGCSSANPEFFFVTPDIISDVIAKCPNDDWRLIFGLSRFCGMRCPSEVLTLQWSDILWAENKIRIDAPKTGLRFCALFPEIRPILEQAFEAAPDGQRFCIKSYRYNRKDGRGYNPGTTAKKIIERAGHIPWPNIFLALRKTRRNELELAGFRSTAIDAWLGHDDRTAKKHYSRVNEIDFRQASETPTAGIGGGAGGGTQASLGGHESPNEKRKRLKPSENPTVASDVSFGVTPTGLEPVLPP